MQEESITLIQHGSDIVHAEAFALSQAEATQVGYLSPTNDYQVMAGQVGVFIN